MKNLFKDQALQQEFDSNGYVIVPMLTPSDIDQLNALFQKYFPEVPIGFASSTYLSDYKTKREISDATSAIMAPKIANWLKGHRLIGSAFLSKAPDQRSQLPMHQDWTIVDEDNFDALNLWTPLTPITEENGILEMLPGSQETFRVVRAPSMPFIAQGHEELIYPHMVKLDVKPGEVVILNQAVVHFSGPNRSKESRIALTTGATSDLASLQFHYWNSDEQLLETFEMEKDYHLRYENFFEDIFKRPIGKEPISKKNFQYHVLTREQVLRRLPQSDEHNLNSKLKTLWQKLWN